MSAQLEFTYEAKSRLDEIIKGKIEAASEEEAIAALHERGLTVLSLASSQKALFSRDIGGYFSKPNNKDVVVFTRQLATVIAADVPVIEGLETISRQSEKPAFAKIVSELAGEIRGGG